MRSAYFKRGGLTTFLLLIIDNGADFGASPGKSEAVDASESERDVHQRGVRDNHETAESFGTRVAFCLIVDLAFDFRFTRTRARSRELSLERFFSAMMLKSYFASVSDSNVWCVYGVVYPAR
jgi:hypothetical protein